MPTSPPPLIVMGVSGSGKSTIGIALARSFGIPFVDGDDLHPAHNRDKMAAGQPLNDEDRAPWLEIIAERVRDDLAAGTPIVVACSALKRRYRDQLVRLTPSTVLIHLVGDRALIAARQAGRNHEYMPNSLLDSQFAALEPLEEGERAFEVSLDQTPEQILAEIHTRLAALTGETVPASETAPTPASASAPAAVSETVPETEESA
ncbi:gluconokinase [Mycetocola saprophilus]|uniref:gluconokinase n=1 Tax=Mycetocola saprophilus TaxID=76636 RepID=UPI000A9D5025|nr:gluconokinase [Mycetocola saprophilus]